MVQETNYPKFETDHVLHRSDRKRICVLDQRSNDFWKSMSPCWMMRDLIMLWCGSELWFSGGGFSLVSDEVFRRELWIQPALHAHDWYWTGSNNKKKCLDLILWRKFLSREGAVSCWRKKHLYLHFAKEIHFITTSSLIVHRVIKSNKWCQIYCSWDIYFLFIFQWLVSIEFQLHWQMH